MGCRDADRDQLLTKMLSLRWYHTCMNLWGVQRKNVLHQRSYSDQLFLFLQFFFFGQPKPLKQPRFCDLYVILAALEPPIADDVTNEELAEAAA